MTANKNLDIILSPSNTLLHAICTLNFRKEEVTLNVERWYKLGRRIGGIGLLAYILAALYILFVARPYEAHAILYEVSGWALVALAVASSIAMITDFRRVPFNLLMFLALGASFVITIVQPDTQPSNLNGFTLLIAVLLFFFVPFACLCDFWLLDIFQDYLEEKTESQRRRDQLMRTHALTVAQAETLIGYLNTRVSKLPRDAASDVEQRLAEFVKAPR